VTKLRGIFLVIIPQARAIVNMIPEELRLHNNWLIWHRELHNGRWTKVPYQGKNPDAKAESNNPETWCNHKMVSMISHKNKTGIGYVFDGSGIYGIDLDGAFNPDGSVYPPFIPIINEIKSYQEISPSDTGLHIICRCNEEPYPSGKTRQWITDAMGNPVEKDNPGLIKREVGVFGKGKYFTFTDRQYNSTETIENIPVERIRELLDPFLADVKSVKAPVSERITNLSDDEIISLCHNAKNGGKFYDLFDKGYTTGYQSASEADMALASILGFYTQDTSQIKRIMERGALSRDKYQRDGYLDRTAGKAISLSGETYKAPRFERVAFPPSEQQQPVDAPEPLPLYSDGWVSDTFNILHGKNVRYCSDKIKNGMWYVWNNLYWKPDITGEVPGLIRSTIHEKLTETVIQDPDNKQKIKFLTSADSSRVIHSALYILQSNMCTVLSENLDADNDRVNVENGVLNLKTLQLEEPDKSRYITKIMRVKYDATATCPVWENHINIIFGTDAETKNSIQQILGYCLLHDNPEQMFFILWGQGENGKSKTIMCLSKIMGDYTKNASPSTFMYSKNIQDKVRSDIARLNGSHMVSAIEGQQGHRLNESLIKAITGGDKQTARMNYDRCEYDFELQAKILLGTNVVPVIRDRTHAMWRRVILIPFNIQIPNEIKDPNIVDKFMAEKSGILNWLLKGLEMYYANKKITLSKSITDATQEYKKTSDEFGGFFEGYEFTGNGFDAIPKKDIWDAFTTWYNDEFGSQPKFSMRVLGKELEEKKCVSVRRNIGMVWLGIKKITDTTSQSKMDESVEVYDGVGIPELPPTRARVGEVSTKDTQTYTSTLPGSDLKNKIPNDVAHQRFKCIDNCGRPKLDWCIKENIIYPFCGVVLE
jgi:putative DNA primase/helicase